MATITYYPDIPQPSDIISDSQSEILANFEGIANWTNQDHYSFQTGTDGQHKQVTFPLVKTAPSPTGAVGVVTTQTSNSKSELFFTNSTANTQLTNTSLTASSGQGMLPGGLQIRTGFVSSGSSVSFLAFPTGIISVLLTSYATATQFDVTGSPAVGGFTFSPAIPGGAGLYWMAIGY